MSSAIPKEMKHGYSGPTETNHIKMSTILYVVGA